MENNISYINTKFEHSPEITKDLATLMLAFHYLKSFPLHNKFGWKNTKDTICFCQDKIFRKSFIGPWNNKVPSKIGAWLYLHRLPYPNILYKFFPAPFGHNIVLFMECMMSILNSMDMPKKDWEALLNFIETVEMTDNQRRELRWQRNYLADVWWKCYNAEKYGRKFIWAGNEEELEKAKKQLKDMEDDENI